MTRRFWNVVERHGAWRALSLLARRGVSLLYQERRLLLFSAAVGEIDRVQPRLAAPDRFIAQRMAPAEALAMTGPVIREVLESHLRWKQPGDELIVGTCGGTLVAWNLIGQAATGRWPLTETDSELSIPPSDAVFTAGFVVPDYRGRRVFQAMYGASADHAQQLGLLHLWSWCEHFNHPSRRAMEAVGFHPMGTHSRRWILGRPMVLRVRDSRELHGG